MTHLRSLLNEFRLKHKLSCNSPKTRYFFEKSLEKIHNSAKKSLEKIHVLIEKSLEKVYTHTYKEVWKKCLKEK